jgi:hypothetical protein
MHADDGVNPSGETQGKRRRYRSMIIALKQGELHVGVGKTDWRAFSGSGPALSLLERLGLVLISINQRTFGPVEPLFADTPESLRSI